METRLIAELLDHSGRVKERHRITGAVFTVGRAYDNDFILDDPFVCPHHLLVEATEGGGHNVKDLDSINGLYTLESTKKVESAPIVSGTTLKVGRSILRFRHATHTVEPALPDRNRPGGIVSTLLESRLVAIMAMTLLVSIFYVDSYFESFNAFEPEKLFFSGLLPLLSAVLLWVGAWTLISRITTHSFHFIPHSIIAQLTLVTLSLSEALLFPYISFAFGADTVAEWVEQVTEVVILTLMLLGHLSYCSQQSIRKLFAVSAGLSIVVLGLASLGSYLDRQEYSSAPAISPVLKPPVFQVTKSSDLSQFLSKTDELKQKIDEAVEKESQR